MSNTLLYAERLNHGQSSIVLEKDNRRGTARTVATNLVCNVLRKHLAPDAYDLFSKQLGAGIGQSVTVELVSAEPAAELGLA